MNAEKQNAERLAEDELKEAKVALVVGGTSGIGEAIAKKLAAEQCNVIISGRNSDKGEMIVKQLSKLYPAHRFSFKKIDMSLISNISEFSKSFQEDNAKLNYLVISCGFMSTNNGRDETIEGIDKKLAVNYYGRHFLIQRLLPLLQKTADLNQDACVMSVFAATKGSHVAEGDDFGLRKNFSLYNASQAAPFYNDLMVEGFWKQNDNNNNNNNRLSFIHVYPGFVDTNIGNELPWYAKYPFKFASLFARSTKRCAEIMVQKTLLNPLYRRGWFLVDEEGRKCEPIKDHTKELVDSVWKHTIEINGKALNGKAYDD